MGKYIFDLYLFENKKKNFLKIMKKKSRFLNKIIWNLWLIYEKNQNQNKNLSFFSLI